MASSRSPVSVWFSVLIAAAALVLPALAATPGGPRDLVLIDVAEQPKLIEHDVPVIWKGASFILAEWDAAQQQQAHDWSIRFRVLAPNFAADRALHMFELDEGEQPPLEWAPHLVHRQGLKTVVVMDEQTADRWQETGYHGVRISREPHGWKGLAPQAFNCSANPVVADLVARMDATRYTDWIEKLSGVEPVEVGGVSAAIATRASSRLFTGMPHARGFDFLTQQMQSWHYGPAPATIEIDPYTSSSSEGATWNNLVLTIPGQTNPAEQVLFTAHFDSISGSSTTLAPGADDNGTGSALLFEAARLLRQFRFQRTIKIIWFTGEEQGLRGSAAYVADHPPLSAILGVVNMDMAGYDGPDGDRCFEMHVGTLPQSDPIGQCLVASTSLYSPTLLHDYLTVGATDRSDHASFWNASTPVGAIEISENFFPEGTSCGPAEPNPFYHTTSDVIGVVSLPFAFDISRAAMATVAALAGPIQACFTGAPALAGNPGSSVVDLSWSSVAGATTYRVYRSKGGCQGQWTEVATSAGTSWSDFDAIDPVSYSYHVEAVAADGFCVSAASNCVSATPTVYRARVNGAAPADVCAAGGPGSGDGIVDPGETVTLPISLVNDGNVALTSIAGLLSTAAADLSAADPQASWPDLTPTQSALSQPNHFTIHLDDLAECGPRLDLDLALGYNQGGNPTGLSLYTGGTTPVALASANFTGGLPAGWTTVDGGSGGGAAATWTTANPGARSIGAPFAAPFAIVDSSNAGSVATQNEQLLTPVVDATGCRQVTLSFSNQFRYDSVAPYEFADVDVSTDGGTNWTNVLHLLAQSDGYTTPNTKTIDITALVAANPSSVRARFRYYQGQNDFWWAIDNVAITCADPVCNPCALAAGPPGEAGTTLPLVVRRQAGNLVFNWGAPAAGCGASSYAVYRGDLTTLAASAYSHDTSLACAQPGNSLSVAETDPRLGNADYYLVVADNGSEEGSYGRQTGGLERPVSAAACLGAQDLAACP